MSETPCNDIDRMYMGMSSSETLIPSARSPKNVDICGKVAFEVYNPSLLDTEFDKFHGSANLSSSISNSAWKLQS